MVIVFYRGGWCPYCNLQLREYDAKNAEFQKHKASVVAVSVDKPDPSLLPKESQQLKLTVLSDSEGKTTKDYRLEFKVPKDLQKTYEGYGINLEKNSG